MRQAGEDYALPAACQGRASPDALDWLARACPDRRLLDVGGGTGGRAAYATADRFGVRPLLVDPMRGACRTARDFFGLPAVRRLGGGVAGRDRRLPGRLVPRRALHDVAAARVPGGAAPGAGGRRRPRPVGVRTARRAAADAPEGNDFPTAAELDRQVRDAGFVVVDRLPYDELPPTPSAWSERADRVQAVIAAEHGAGPRYRVAQDQQQRIVGLLADGAVGGELVHARPADRS